MFKKEKYLVNTGIVETVGLKVRRALRVGYISIYGYLITHGLLTFEPQYYNPLDIRPHNRLGRIYGKF